MAMRVRTGTPAMCMAMDLLEQRECALSSSGGNPSRAAPTCLHSALMTDMAFEAPTEHRPWWVGQSLTVEVGSHPCSRRRRKMLAPNQTGQAARNSNLKWETVSPQMAFFWLSRVRKIWVTCWNHSIGVWGGEEGVTKKDDNVLEWKELSWPVMASVLGVLVWRKAEVESQDNQVGGVSVILETMEWTMPRGIAFYHLIGGSSIL